MERRAFRLNGFAVLLGLVVLAAVAAVAAFAGTAGAVAAIALAVVVVLLATGFTVINPNESTPRTLNLTSSYTPSPGRLLVGTKAPD